MSACVCMRMCACACVFFSPARLRMRVDVTVVCCWGLWFAVKVVGWSARGGVGVGV